MFLAALGAGILLVPVAFLAAHFSSAQPGLNLPTAQAGYMVIKYYPPSARAPYTADSLTIRNRRVTQGFMSYLNDHAGVALSGGLVNCAGNISLPDDHVTFHLTNGSTMLVTLDDCGTITAPNVSTFDAHRAAEVQLGQIVNSWLKAHPAGASG